MHLTYSTPDCNEVKYLNLLTKRPDVLLTILVPNNNCSD